jgi:hypothetical protein
MTAQDSDEIAYNDDKYVLIGDRTSGPFDPTQYGIRPDMIHTAFYRGYYRTYRSKGGAI